MNYFDELLESYNKLKKRTFKLVYLNEDEESARLNAEAKVRELLSTQGSLSDSKGRLIEILPGDQSDQLQAKASNEVPKEGEDQDLGNINKDPLVINWAGFGGHGTIYYQSAEQFEGEKPEQFGKLVNALMDPNISKNFEDNSEVNIKKLVNREGTVYDVAEINDIIPEIYTKMTKFVSDIQEEIREEFGDDRDAIQAKIKKKYPLITGPLLKLILKDLTPDGLSTEGLKAQIESEIFNFVEGADGLGKVFDGDKLLTGEEDDSGSTIEKDVNPSLVYETLLALDKVLSYVTNPNDSQENCDSLKGLITDVKGFKGKKPRTLLKLSGSKEGLILPLKGFVPTTLKSKLSVLCPKAIETLNVGPLSNRSLSAKKGTLHESLTKFLYLLHTARRTKGNAELTATITEDLRETITLHRTVIDHLVSTMKGSSGWKTVDENLSDDLVMFENDLFNSKERNKEFNKFIMTYYAAQVKLFDQVQADTMVHSGKTSKQGDRKDNVFVFKKKEDAEAAGIRLGKKVTETTTSALKEGASNNETSERSLEGYPETVYTIGLGQKMYNELHGSKGGEYNDLSRANDAALGILEGDSKVADGFMGAIEDRFPLKNATKDAFIKINKQTKKIRKLLTKSTTAKGSDGKVTKSDPITVAKSIVEALNSKLSYGSLDEKKISSFDVTTNFGRAQLAELIERENQMSTINSLLKGDTASVSTAKNMILRSAFACGGNAVDILQSVYTQNDNQVHTYSHNYVFDQIGKDLENVEIVKSGSGFNIEYKGLKMRLNYDPTGAPKTMSKNTRTWLEIRKDTVKKASEALKSHLESNTESSTDDIEDENIEDDLKELFDIQNKLLSKLLG